MRAFLLAASLLATALLFTAPAAAEPSCDTDVDEDGQYGAGCRLFDICYSVMWGYHSDFLTVGGGSSCSGGVWVNPDEEPEGPVPPSVETALCNVQTLVC